MNEPLTYFGDYSWIIQIFVVVFLTLLINFLQARILTHLSKRLQKNQTYWDDALVDIARPPVKFLIWLIGLCFAADIAANHGAHFFLNVIDVIREFGIIFIIVWFVLDIIKHIEKRVSASDIATAKGFDQSIISAVAKLIRLSVIISAFMVMLQTLGYSLNSMLAFGGIGGMVAGFAAKDLLANLFGGLILYIERPFAIGDWIRSPDRDIEGVVEYIGWRLTKIRTFDKRPLYVPNSVFNSIAVENPSRMTNRRIKEVIGIRYADADKMQSIIDGVRNMLQTHQDIDAQQTLIVNFDQFAPSSLDFFIYTFTKTTDWILFHQVKQDVLLKIIDIISAHGAECAFPTSTLHVADHVSINHMQR